MSPGTLALMCNEQDTMFMTSKDCSTSQRFPSSQSVTEVYTEQERCILTHFRDSLRKLITFGRVEVISAVEATSNQMTSAMEIVTPTSQPTVFQSSSSPQALLPLSPKGKDEVRITVSDSLRKIYEESPSDLPDNAQRAREIIKRTLERTSKAGQELPTPFVFRKWANLVTGFLVNEGTNPDPWVTFANGILDRLRQTQSACSLSQRLLEQLDTSLLVDLKAHQLAISQEIESIQETREETSKHLSVQRGLISKLSAQLVKLRKRLQRLDKDLATHLSEETEFQRQLSELDGNIQERQTVLHGVNEMIASHERQRREAVEGVERLGAEIQSFLLGPLPP